MAQQNDAQQKHLSPVEAPRQRSQPKYLQIRDLNKFQHYKDRNPPWIKLHAHFLEDYEFQQLPDHTKYHFFMLMLLASRCGNRIPNDPEWIRVKIGAHEPVDLAAMLRFGLLEPISPRKSQRLPLKGELPFSDDETPPPEAASKMLAGCYQDASPETETQTQTEGEGETEAQTEQSTAAASAGEPVCVPGRFQFSEYLRYVEHLKASGIGVNGRPIENPGGVARVMQKTGYADSEVELFLRPPPPRPKREFTDQPCTHCFGSKMETIPGKGARHCEHCLDEEGRRTGKEPADTLSQTGGPGP